LEYGRVLIVCSVEEEKPCGGAIVVGVDLGVNTLACATDGKTAIAVSGRAVKETVQYRNKRLASISEAQSKKTCGSRRHKRLQRRKYALLDKTKRRVRDLCHKATRKIINAFPKARFVVGKPFNEAAQRIGRVQAQQVSQACPRKLIRMLKYKGKGAIVVPEPYSSQTCPVCGCRQKCRRTYRCGTCGFEAPRDVVGALNIRQIGLEGTLSPTPGLQAPQVRFVHPNKYPGRSQVVPAEPRQVAQGPSGL
jgi:putative transposase